MGRSEIRRRRVVVAAVALTLLSACATGEPTLKGAVRNPPLRVSGISLPGPDGTDVSMQAEPGQLLVVYFGYTGCPDVCPTTMADISRALTDLDLSQAERVTVAMVTVDPERDSLETLTAYLGSFFSRGVPIRTEDPERLLVATEAFGVQYEIEAHEPGAAYDVAHTAITYVIDDAGTVVVEWPFGFETESMAADLTALLEEQRT